MVVLCNDAAHLHLLWFPSALTVKPLKKKTQQNDVADVAFLCSLFSQEVLVGLAIFDKKNSKKKVCIPEENTKFQGG